jgi:tetratricopeptide (TPR) repeat protein
MLIWLGPARARFIFVLLAATGLASLMLNAVRPPLPWVVTAQSALAVLFLIGAVGAVLTRFSGPERLQMILLVGPAVIALAIGLFFPALTIFMLVLAAGWMFIGPLLVRSRIRREYRAAIRHLRKGEYVEAIQDMDGLIEAEPGQADHYRFRAELYRLAGKVKRARADYEKVVELAPDSGVGYNGLAEVYLQTGEYEKALGYARQALEREVTHWVAPYNLGMIEDRLGMWSEAVEHLNQAFEVGMPDSRHRLLAYLWITRAYSQQGKNAEAVTTLEHMKQEQSGLREWKIIFESEEAAVLREVLAADVELAERLVEGKVALEALTGTQQQN